MARKPKPLPSLDWLRPRLRVTRALVLIAFFGLAALLLGWNLFYADLHGARTWVVLCVQLLPLLLVAPGLLMAHVRTYAWACFLINLYFIQGVLAAFDPARRVFGWLELSFSVVVFCAALLYTRWRFQYERKRAGEA